MITSLHVSTARSWRGGENQLYLLALGLRARGQRAIVAAPPGSPLLERCLAEKIDARPLRVRGELDVFGALQLAALLRRERPDVLHLHDGHAVLPGKMAARFSFLKGLSVVAHRRTVFKIKGRGKYGGRIDRVIAISRAVRDELLAAGIAPEKVRVVYSGMNFPQPLAADALEVRAFRERFHIPADAFLIAHAAALTSEKRQLDILAALELTNQNLKARGLSGVHLALAGSGILEDDLKRAAKSLGLDGHVHFLGFQQDLRPLWAAASMAVYASVAEGLCTALVEAQGTGLPAVITRAGGMVEVIEDGATGVIVDVGDTRKLSESILFLREDDARRARMGEQARVRARSLFSADAMTDGVLAAYRELVAVSPRPC